MSLSAYAIKKPAFVFGVEDMMLVKDSPSMRLTASPFTQDAENVVFLGHAAPWKGKHGAAFWDIADSYKGKKGSVGNGLKAAIAISKACANITGTARVGGRLLPKKVICQMEKASKA
jgi:hypothetical protein